MVFKSTAKKIIRQEAKLVLKQGLPKQTVYEMLLVQYKYAKNVADAIRFLPSKKNLTKYGIWNYVFLGLHFLMLFWFFLFAVVNYDTNIYIYFSLLELAFIYVIWSRQIEFYDILMLFGVIYLIISAFAFFYAKVAFELFMPFIALHIILLIILPSWLRRKLCPAPLVRKVPYTNSEGKEKLKLEYEFPD